MSGIAARVDPAPATSIFRSWLRALLPLVAASAMVATGAVPPRADAQARDHEIWVLDQGVDRISVYSSNHDLVSAIDVSPAALRQVNPDFNPASGVTVPHMIDFDSQHRYAFVASTSGGVTIVIDANQRRVVAALLTGAGTHMASPTPDDRAVWVAAIGAQQLVEIPLDLDAEEPVFQVGAIIPVGDLLTQQTEYAWPSFSPVCHRYNSDGSEAWFTLGPGIAQGGLFVLDTRTHQVVHAYDPAHVRANCGVAFSRDKQQVLTNWSGIFGTAAQGNDREGNWYAFDAVSKEWLKTESSGGVDAHGVRVHPARSVYWQVNRGSNNGILIDETTLDIVGSFPAGDTPDILDFSPDGSLAYISQRGPVPRSGDPHVATGNNPGVIVVDTETFRVVAELIPERTRLPAGHARAGELANDVHGLAVRTVSGREIAVFDVLSFAAADLVAGDFFCAI